MARRPIAHLHIDCPVAAVRPGAEGEATSSAHEAMAITHELHRTRTNPALPLDVLHPDHTRTTAGTA
eukprot:4318189-Prymnesium_polylepis.1